MTRGHFDRPALAALALLATGTLGAQPPGPACPPANDAGDRQGVVEARVLDVASDAGVPGAVVTAYWRLTTVAGSAVRSDPVERTARADSSGIVRLCGIPAGVPLLAWAEVSAARSVPAEIVVPDGDTLRFTFRVPARELRSAADLAAARPAAAPNARVAGAVRTPGGAPITGARVRLALGGTEVRTDSAGRFVLPVVGPGSRQLDVLALGWAPERRWIDFDADRTTQVEIVLDTRVRTLEEVRIVAASPFERAFEARRRRGSGYFLDQARIDQDATGSIIELVRTMPSLSVNGTGIGRQISTLRRGRNCPITVFLDGSPVDQLLMEGIVTPDMLYGIEFYPGFASPPIQYTSFDKSGCGTLLLWTRDHAKRREKAKERDPDRDEDRGGDHGR